MTARSSAAAQDPRRAVDVLERLWLTALWGGARPLGRVTAMGQGSGFSG